MDSSNVVKLPLREHRAAVTPLTFLEQATQTPAPAKGRIRIKCPEERGMFVLITANDARGYYVEARVRGRKKQRKVRLGGVRPHDDQYITFPQALSMAKLEKSKAHSMDKDGKGIDISRTVTHTAGILVGEAYVQYKADQTNPKIRKRIWAPRTLEKYETMMERIVGWRGRGLFTIDREELAKLYKAIAAERGACEASQTFRCFRAMFNFFAVDLEPIPTCPTIALNSKSKDLWYKIEDDERRIIEEKDFPAWWRSMKGIGAHVGNASAWELYFLMQPVLGLRRMETLLLEWSWWDKDARVITLPKEITKPRRRLKVPVGRRMTAMIEAHRATQTPGTLFFFASKAGRRLTNPGNIIARHRKKHPEMPPWSCHDNRRVYASEVHALNPGEKTMKLLLNHSVKGDVTLLYVQLRKELHEAQQKIEDRIFKRAKLR